MGENVDISHAQQRGEGRPLHRLVHQLRDGSQRPLSDFGPVDRVGQGQDVVLNLGGQASESHDLGYSGAGDTFAKCNLGLGADVAGVKLAPPLLSLSEELDHPGGLRLLGRLGRPSGIRGHVHDPVGGDAPFEGSHTPVRERRLGADSYFNGLFVQLGPGYDVVVVQGDMLNPEPNFGRALPTGSNAVTFGEPILFPRNSVGIQVSAAARRREPPGFSYMPKSRNELRGFRKTGGNFRFGREILGIGGKRGVSE